MVRTQPKKKRKKKGEERSDKEQIVESDNVLNHKAEAFNPFVVLRGKKAVAPGLERKKRKSKGR